jgi:hypothetical protein
MNLYVCLRDDSTIFAISTSKDKNAVKTNYKLDDVKKYLKENNIVLTDGYHKYIDDKIIRVDYLNEVTRLEKIDTFRKKRSSECFSVINRGSLWYDSLSDSQKQELKVWYNEWLDVTKTLVEPKKPDWLI